MFPFRVFVEWYDYGTDSWNDAGSSVVWAEDETDARYLAPLLGDERISKVVEQES